MKDGAIVIWKRRAAKVLLVAAALLFVACQKKGEGDPAGTLAPEPTLAAPEPTGGTGATKQPEPTAALTQEAGQVPGDGLPSQAAFPTVSPVPEEMVADIAGAIHKGDFPVIDGSTATIPLSEAVYQIATGEDKEAAEAAITHTKTTNSYNRLYSGEADLLIVYEPAQSIIDRMQTEELFIKPIGLDALVFMGNAANPVDSLTKEQLVDIYSGAVHNWAEVGGEDAELLAFQRPVGSGSQTLMQKLVMGDTPMEEGDNIFRYYTMGDILLGMLAYTGDDNTLGYSVFYYANSMYSLPDLKFLGVDGVIPSVRTIYDASYPFVNAFYAVIRPDEPEGSNAHKIFDWLTGENGQRMILDLGYVPVQMPEGAELVDTAAGAEADIVLTPVKKLEKGQHFIFLQTQDVDFDFEYDYGTITIYNDEWEKCAAFYNAWTDHFTRGVCDGRYIRICQARAGAGGELDTLDRVYDLQENRFLEIPGFVLSIIDGKKGYFLCAVYNEDGRMVYSDGEPVYYEKVVDLNGNTLADFISYNEYSSLAREGDYYRSNHTRWVEDAEGKRTRYTMYQIYDLDFHLKSEIYTEKEHMPAEGDRQPGVLYIWTPDGCILDKDGNVLIDMESFKEKFGISSDEAARIDYKGIKLHEDDTQLYSVTCGKTVYYVDKTMDFYAVYGEDSGTWRGGTVPGDAAPYYTGREGWYLAKNGGPLLMQDRKKPDQVSRYGDEAYILVRKQEDGVVVEEYIPGEGSMERYEYPVAMGRYDSVSYMGIHTFAIEGHDTALEESGSRRELNFYIGEEKVGCLDGDYIFFGQNYDWADNQEEGLWLAQVSKGDRRPIGSGGLDGSGTAHMACNYYVLFQDGKFIELKEPGDLQHCCDGYLQIDCGDYTYVYDYNGNIIIKALDGKLIED